MSRFIKNIFIQLAMMGGLLLAVSFAHATDIAYSGTFVGTEGLATSSGQTQAATYTRNFNTTGDRVTLQVVASTYTLAASVTFTTSSYVVNTPTITIASNNFTTGLPVLYSTGTSPAISGLTNQTTYYISVIGPNNNGVSSRFKLASTSTGAVAGVGIVLASSTTATNSYTLAPLAFANTSGGGIQLQASNDGSNFVNLTTGNWAAAISSVTFSSSGNNTLWDLGPIQYKYLRLKETPPTTGAMNYTVTSNERYSNIH
jgi:hypothetical protein